MRAARGSLGGYLVCGMSRGKLWNCALDQSQKSGVACLRFEPTSRRLDGRVHSDCAFNLLTYLGAEPAASSENPLKLLRIRVDFDSTIRRFESSRPSQPVRVGDFTLRSVTNARQWRAFANWLSVSGVRTWPLREQNRR